VAIRANDWIRQAERNLKSGEVNYSNQLYEEACYESHQASEKAIKALLKTYYKDLRGRSLIYLIQPIVHSLSISNDIFNCMQSLDRQYIPTRYPDAYDQGAPLDYYNEADAQNCLECARKILSWVKNIGNL
jgi:HEPN domain-containing protein